MGKRCMGALEFEPAIEGTFNSQQRIELDNLVDVAREALTEKDSFQTNLTMTRKLPLQIFCVLELLQVDKGRRQLLLTTRRRGKFVPDRLKHQKDSVITL